VPVLLPLLGLTTILPERWAEPGKTIDTAAEEDGSFVGRLNAWQTHFCAAVNRPLLGARPYTLNEDAILAPSQRYESIDYESRQGGRATHSGYLQIIAQLALLVFAVYAAVAATAWFNVQRVICWPHRNAELL
jgi:O-antigen ligase